MLSEIQLEKINEPLLSWFETHKRVLPWRENPTPYRVWVSEIMLQQTRVAVSYTHLTLPTTSRV